MGVKENRKKWVEALRSGEYEQTTDSLQDGNGFCCLGVAVVLYEKETGLSAPRNRLGHICGDEVDDLSSYLDPVRCWLGLKDSEGRYLHPDKGMKKLTTNNDGGMSFAEIADIIESEPPGLFVED